MRRNIRDRFQSTGPLRDPTILPGPGHRHRADFNPQVPCGTRQESAYPSPASQNFNPQVPCGTRHPSHGLRQPRIRFQSTGPLRDPTAESLSFVFLISISIHRSLAGPDATLNFARQGFSAFQSTGPLRDPTDQAIEAISVKPNFNPQVPCGTRLERFNHVLLLMNFNPQVPCGTRPARCESSDLYQGISIHRSLAGPDGEHGSPCVRSGHFNPQVPCGTRRGQAMIESNSMSISIHRSLAGPD